MDQPTGSCSNRGAAMVVRTRQGWLRMGAAAILTLAFTWMPAQDPQFDQLRESLKNETDPERRVDQLIKLSMLLFDHSKDTASLIPFQEAMELATRMRYERGLAYAAWPAAVHAYVARDHQRCIARCKECIRQLDGSGISQALGSPLGLIRHAYNAAGLQEERRAFYAEALERYSASGMEENAGTCHHGLGGYYLLIRQYGRAIEHYFKAREIYQRTNLFDASNEDMVIGQVYVLWGNPDHAEPFLKDALDFYRKIGDAKGLSRTIIIVGDMELQRGDTAKAIACFREARSHWDRLIPLEAAIGRSKLLQAFCWTGSLDSARTILDTLAQQRKRMEIPFSSHLGECEIEYGEYLYHWARGDHAVAVRFLEEGLKAAIAQDVLRLVLRYRKELAIRSEELGNAAQAWEQAIAYMALGDSLQTVANKDAVATYEGQMQERESALALQEQRAQLDRQRLLTMGVIAFALLLGVMVVTVVRSNRRKQRANRELEAARQRAEASERFKQQFLANMSHEIRTPMNAIMGMSGILKRNQHSPEQEKYLNAISQSSENLLVILNDILDLSKLEAGKIDLEKVPFDPRQVIDNVCDILRFKAEEKGLAVEVVVDKDVPPMILGDPVRLNQIVLNLAGNAVKFTEHGAVTIRVHPSVDPQGRPGWVQLRIVVTDTGIGIPEDRLNKIFEEFTQAYSDTTRKFGGTGLGLTISKRLVELQGGSITARSEQGKGSTFTVTIPYAIAQEVAEAQCGRDMTRPHELQGLRILLAEDNDFNVMVAQDELADAIPGVQVDVAANGLIAVEMAQANDYDVILMDVQMPEMNGYDATKAIRALPGSRSSVPILAMTANVMKEDLDRCVEAGMQGHVPKPFKRDELMGALRLALLPPARRW